MNIRDIIKNQDILDCWKEIQKSNVDKNISKEVFEYDIEEYHTFLLDEIIEASQYMDMSTDTLINEMLLFTKNNKSLVILGIYAIVLLYPKPIGFKYKNIPIVFFNICFTRSFVLIYSS